MTRSSSRSGALYSLLRPVEAMGLEQRSVVRALEVAVDDKVAERLRRPPRRSSSTWSDPHAAQDPGRTAVMEVQRIGCLRDQPVEWRETLIRGDRFSVAALWSAQEGYRMGVAGDEVRPGPSGRKSAGATRNERPSLNSERRGAVRAVDEGDGRMSEWHSWEDVRDELVDVLGSPEGRLVGVEQLRREQSVAKLVELRKRAGLRHVDVAERMGVSKARVSHIEHGAVATVDLLARHLDAIGGRLELTAEFDGGAERIVLRWPAV